MWTRAAHAVKRAGGGDDDGGGAEGGKDGGGAEGGNAPPQQLLPQYTRAQESAAGTCSFLAAAKLLECLGFPLPELDVFGAKFSQVGNA